MSVFVFILRFASSALRSCLRGARHVKSVSVAKRGVTATRVSQRGSGSVSLFSAPQVSRVTSRETTWKLSRTLSRRINGEEHLMYYFPPTACSRHPANRGYRWDRRRIGAT